MTKSEILSGNVSTQKGAYRGSDNSRPVSFITEDEVNRMAEAAKVMGKAGDRNKLLILLMLQDFGYCRS